jgi:hypothetical protein
LLAAWLAGCTTTVVDFALHDAPPRDSGAGGQGGTAGQGPPPVDAAPEVPAEDAASPGDSLDGPVDEAPDVEPTVVNGPAHFVTYKCCASSTDCFVETQGDATVCRDLGALKTLAGLTCDSKGWTLVALEYMSPCEIPDANGFQTSGP